MMRAPWRPALINPCIHRNLDVFLSEPLFNSTLLERSGINTCIDKSKNEWKTEIDLEFNSVKPEDLKISLKDNTLTIEGTSEINTVLFDGSNVKSTREWKQDFHLPQNIDVETINASISDNLLTIVGELQEIQPLNVP